MKKKKKRPYNRRNHILSVDILEGKMIEEAGTEHGFKTKQAAHKAFRLTAVNLFLFDDRQKIIKSGYDINVMRELWRKSKTGYFL